MGCGNLTTGNGTVSSRHRDAVQTPVLLTALVGILILLTVFGNVLVVIAVITNRALKAPQNLFLVSLACADILVATLVMPFSLANELMGYWYFGKVWCEIYLALDVLFCTSSIVHLCAISLDRYWSISRAVEYNAKRTPGMIKSTVFVLWALAAIISFPPLITMEKKGEKVEGPTCMINKEGWYIIFSSTASFFAPCLIMVLVYGRIYQIAKRRTRAPPGEKIKEDGGSAGGRRRGSKGQDGASGKTGVGGSAKTDGAPAEEQCSSSEGNETTGQSLKEERGARGAKRPQEGARSCGKMRRWRGRRNREKRLTFVLAVVVGVFVVCWFPFFFTYSLTAVCRACCVPEALFKMFFWFGYCNSSLNPVIYTVFNTDFRRAFKKILCRAKSRGV